MKSMYYIVKTVPYILLGKTCILVGLHEAKGDPLEKENEIKNRSLRFAACKQFVWWIYQRCGKGKEEFSHHVFCGK